MEVSVFIQLKDGVLDPEGETLRQSLRRLGFHEVDGVRVGKHLQISLAEDNTERARRRAEQMCEDLLANPVIEDYQVRMKEELS